MQGLHQLPVIKNAAEGFYSLLRHFCLCIHLATLNVEVAA